MAAAKKSGNPEWKRVENDFCGFATPARNEPPLRGVSITSDQENEISESVDSLYDLEDRIANVKVDVDAKNGGSPHRFKDQKVHKAIRSKECRKMPQSDGSGKPFHIKTRNYKIIARRVERLQSLRSSASWSPTTFLASSGNNQSRSGELYRGLSEAQLRAAGMSSDLIAFLIAILDRDITPEDYDNLLRLDEFVVPTADTAMTSGVTKITRKILERFPVTTLTADDERKGFEPPNCVICMETFECDDSVRTLLCGHSFHVECIDHWLWNISSHCPLDMVSVLAPKVQVERVTEFDATKQKLQYCRIVSDDDSCNAAEAIPDS